MSKSEIKSALKALGGGKLTRGTITEKFENAFAAYIGQKFAVATNSGTSALHLAVRAAGWKKGDEVITSPFSYIASANCLIYEGVIPRFVDINPQTLTIDVDLIEKKITKRTKGILIVDIFGLPVGERAKLVRLKKKYNLIIVEDACEAVGNSGPDFEICKASDITVFGFHENKQMTTGGEGGMVVTNTPQLAAYCRSMRDQGRFDGKDWIDKVVLGYNYRMTEMQAAIGIEKLKTISKVLSVREKIANEYYANLIKHPGILCPQDLTSSRRSWFAYFIVLKDEQSRQLLKEHLRMKGIQTAAHYFVPLYQFPHLRKFRSKCPVADMRGGQILVLPLYENLSVAAIKKISRIINVYMKSISI
jgi:perosamine synthetase